MHYEAVTSASFRARTVVESTFDMTAILRIPNENFLLLGLVSGVPQPWQHATPFRGRIPHCLAVG